MPDPRGFEPVALGAIGFAVLLWLWAVCSFVMPEIVWLWVPG